MTPNIVQNVSLLDEEPWQGEAGLCHEGKLQEVRKNLPPDQSLNVQVCSFTSYLLESGLQYCVTHRSNRLWVWCMCAFFTCVGQATVFYVLL